MPLHLGLWLYSVFFGGPRAVRRLCMSGPTFHGLCFKCASGLNCIPSDSLCVKFGVLGCWLGCSSFSISVWKETCFPQFRLEGETARTQLEAAAPRYAMAAAWEHFPRGRWNAIGQPFQNIVAFSKAAARTLQATRFHKVTVPLYELFCSKPTVFTVQTKKIIK